MVEVGAISRSSCAMQRSVKNCRIKSPLRSFVKKKTNKQTTREKRFYRFTRDRSEVLLYTRYKERACVLSALIIVPREKMRKTL